MRFTEPQWRPSAARRSTPPRNLMDVSAFASVMLALIFLMIFGLGYPPVFSDLMPTELPRTSNSTLKPAALRDDALDVTITRDGSVYLRNHLVAPGGLPGFLKQAVRDGSEKTVYIKADARAEYAGVKIVLDQIHLAGLTNITFITQPSRP